MRLIDWIKAKHHMGMQTHYAIADLHFRETERYLRLPELKTAGTYLIAARNAYVGIFVLHEEKPCFLLRRTKFDSTFLDLEFHWDIGAPYGTAKPLAFIEDSAANLDACLEVDASSIRVKAGTAGCLSISQYLEKIENRLGRGAIHKHYRKLRRSRS